MYVVLFGGASFPIVQARHCSTLREAYAAYKWLSGQYTYCVFRNYK